MRVLVLQAGSFGCSGLFGLWVQLNYFSGGVLCSAIALFELFIGSSHQMLLD